MQRPNFEIEPGQTFTTTISTIIAPHFDMAAVLRQDLLYRAAQKVNPKTIILVSTNHFDAGGYDILTTDKTWRLKNASLEADKNLIKKLNLPLDETAFDREHGIFNLLSPINNAFPDAKIVPIILKPTLSRDKTIELARQLDEVCTSNCLMVSSVDFSHYQPGALAEVHDQFTLKALNNLDEDLIWVAETDSSQALSMAIHWAKLHKTEKFMALDNSNSGKLENAPDAESTSFVTGWFERGKTVLETDKTFIAGLNLEKYKDPRFVIGVDEKIELSNERDMALLCHDQSEFCSLNQLFWNAPFWRETQNGLVMAGIISKNQYHLVLLPTDNNGVLLRGEAKLAVINRIRKNLNLSDIAISYGYDTININR